MNNDERIFVRSYTESCRLLAQAITGEMPLGMRLTLTRHAKLELGEATRAADTRPQIELVDKLVDEIIRQEKRLAKEEGAQSGILERNG